MQTTKTRHDRRNRQSFSPHIHEVGVNPLRLIVVMDLGIRGHLAESDDAAVVIETLVLPDRNAVARVKISAAGSPPILIEVSDQMSGWRSRFDRG
jgi:hypothetical protein